jgi:hypothetical protein
VHTAALSHLVGFMWLPSSVTRNQNIPHLEIRTVLNRKSSYRHKSWTNFNPYDESEYSCLEISFSWRTRRNWWSHSLKPFRHWMCLILTAWERILSHFICESFGMKSFTCSAYKNIYVEATRIKFICIVQFFCIKADLAISGFATPVNRKLINSRKGLSKTFRSTY